MRRTVRSNSFWKNAAERFLHDGTAMLGLVLVVIIVGLCLAAPLLTSWDPAAVDVTKQYLPPDGEHILGTDRLGRDMFARLLYGGRETLAITFSAVGLALILGLAIGVFAGVCGGTADLIIMRVTDALAAIPMLLLSIVIEFLFGFGKGYFKYAVALSLVPPLVRLLRPLVRDVMQSEYAEAARALGVKRLEMVAKHVLPNVAAPVLIHVSNTAAEAMLACTIMGYIGLGINPPLPEWGQMVAQGYLTLTTSPHVILTPCIAVMICVLSFNLIGNGLRDALRAGQGRDRAGVKRWHRRRRRALMRHGDGAAKEEA